MIRSKNIRRTRLLAGTRVSILVLLDDSLEVSNRRLGTNMRKVSILVLLDDSLEAYIFRSVPALLTVSILVLLDDSLEVRFAFPFHALT